MMYAIDTVVKITNSWNQQPLWHNNRLYWVDRCSKNLFFLDEEQQKISQIKLSKTAVCLTPCQKNSNLFIITLVDGIALFNLENKTIDYLAKPEPFLTQNHFTGSAVDNDNHLWTFSANREPSRSSGYIYKMDASQSMERFRNGSIFGSSSPVISSDNTLYQVSQHDRYIYKTPILNNRLGNREAFCRISKTEGKPHGICLDSHNHLWVCHLGVGLISRFNPEGERVEKIKFNANLITHCAFGGKQLDTLYVTTASQGLTGDTLRRQPMAGCLLKIHFKNIKGVESRVFLPAEM